MNVIWKEKRDRGGGCSAGVELVFTPSDVVDGLDEQIVIGISITPLKKEKRDLD